MMPAAMRKKGIKLCPLNAKMQLLHCKAETKGSVNSCRDAHAKSGLHESSQGLGCFSTGAARSSEAWFQP